MHLRALSLPRTSKRVPDRRASLCVTPPLQSRRSVLRRDPREPRTISVARTREDELSLGPHEDELIVVIRIHQGTTRSHQGVLQEMRGLHEDDLVVLVRRAARGSPQPPPRGEGEGGMGVRVRVRVGVRVRVRIVVQPSMAAG